MALTITLTPTLNPFRTSCPLRLCGEFPFRGSELGFTKHYHLVNLLNS